MAELCRKCFIEFFAPSPEDITNIVMSEDNEWCEGCCSCGKYVVSVLGDAYKPEEVDYGKLFRKYAGGDPPF